MSCKSRNTHSQIQIYTQIKHYACRNQGDTHFSPYMTTMDYSCIQEPTFSMFLNAPYMTVVYVAFELNL